MNKKIITIAIALALVLTFSSSVSASSDSNLGKPFQAIWNAITGLQDQINNIQLIPGPQGPQGEQGIQGPQGEQGPAGTIASGFLPAPAFESEWISIPPKTAVLDIHHDVGGDINDYFIDATYRRWNGSFSSHENQADKIWWEDVEPNNIQVATNGDVTNMYDAVRIRIWVVQD